MRACGHAWLRVCVCVSVCVCVCVFVFALLFWLEQKFACVYAYQKMYCCNGEEPIFQVGTFHNHPAQFGGGFKTARVM